MTYPPFFGMIGSWLDLLLPIIKARMQPAHIWKRSFGRKVLSVRTAESLAIRSV